MDCWARGVIARVLVGRRGRATASVDDGVRNPGIEARSLVFLLLHALRWTRGRPRDGLALLGRMSAAHVRRRGERKHAVMSRQVRQVRRFLLCRNRRRRARIARDWNPFGRIRTRRRPPRWSLCPRWTAHRIPKSSSRFRPKTEQTKKTTPQFNFNPDNSIALAIALSHVLRLQYHSNEP